MNWAGAWYWLLGSYGILIASAYTKHQFEALNTSSLQFIAYATPLIPLFFGIKATYYFGMESLQGRSVLSITISIFFYLLGDVLWELSDNAVISIADFFWLVAYVFFAMGIFYGIKATYCNCFRNARHTLLMLLTITMLAAAYFFIVPIGLDPEVSLLENLVTDGYVFADILIIIGVILIGYIIYTVRTGIYKWPWILLLAGALLYLIGDTVYALHYDTYQTGNILDLSWYYAYLLYAAAFIAFSQNVQTLLTKFRGKLQPLNAIRKGKSSQ